MLEPLLVCKCISDLAYSRAVLSTVCRDSLIAVRMNRDLPRAWHAALFRCDGGTNELLARVRALRRFASIGLTVQETTQQGDTWGMIALRVVEALTHAHPLQTQPMVLCLTSAAVCCPIGYRLSQHVKPQALLAIIHSLLGPAPCDAARCAIEKFASDTRVRVRATPGDRCVAYPLLTCGDWGTSVYINVDQNPVVDRCTRARPGAISVLTRMQPAQVHGYDSAIRTFKCQRLLDVRYTPELTSVRLVMRLSLLVGAIKLELTGLTPHYECHLGP